MQNRGYLSCSNYCIISKISITTVTAANPTAFPPTLTKPATSIIGATFQVNSSNALSINYIIKFVENLKQGFKRTIFWNIYRSETTKQLRNNNLDFRFDLKFSDIDSCIINGC